MQFRACGCVVSYRFEIGLRDLEIGIGTEVGFSNRRDVEISPFSVVKRLDEIAPTSAGPNHVRFRIQKAQKVGCDSEISLAFRPAVVRRCSRAEQTLVLHCFGAPRVACIVSSLHVRFALV